jgi:hypothetical protein
LGSRDASKLSFCEVNVCVKVKQSKRLKIAVAGVDDTSVPDSAKNPNLPDKDCNSAKW